MLSVFREGIKTKAIKILLFGIMTMAVGGLVLTDVGGFFRSGTTGATNVARIDGNPIPATQFDQTVRRILSRQGMDPAMAYQYGLINQILEARISSELIQTAARDMGAVVSDEVVIDQINELIAPFVNERQTRKDALKQVLLSQGMSEAEFVNALKSEMIEAVLKGAVQLAASVSPEQEVRDLYQHDNETRTVSGVILKNEAIKDMPEITDAELTPLYQAGIERYAIPETRTFTLAVLGEDTIRNDVKVTDEELEQIYNEDIAAYSMPERRVMEQAILASQAEAGSVAQKVTDGEKLKDAVKDVTGKTDAYINKQTFEKDGLLPEISDKAFSAGKGAVIGPVQTTLGWHVLVLVDIKPSEAKPFKTVKEDIRRDIIETRLEESMSDLANAIDDRLASGAPLEDVAGEYKMQLSTIDNVRNDGTTTDARDGVKEFEADRTHILQTAFEMMKGEVSPVIELSNSQFATLRVDDIKEKSYRPFEDVREEIKAAWTMDKQDVLNKQRATDALQSLLKGEKTLKDIASGLDSAVTSYTLKRKDEPPAPITGPAKTKIFETAQGDYTIASVDGGYAIFEITGIALPDASKASKGDLTAVADKISQGTKDEALTAYLDYLRKKYRVSVNQRLLETMYTQTPDQQQF